MRFEKSLLALAAAAASLPAVAAVGDINWTESVFSINRDTPADTSGKQHTGLAWAPDGSNRLFVLEKEGRVRVLSNTFGAGTATWTTFATMSPIYTQSECGLIGMAFDPDFASNGLVYFFVTVGNDEQQIIRYRDSANVGVERTVVRSGLPTNGANHDGGGIGFAADGKLYWSIGDLGSGVGVDANLTSLASKVGRANRDGSLPPDNPFNDGAGSNNDFIYARGFRNPFTMQIQPSTGRIWLNVVGTGYEQVFVVGRGDHAGYNDYENNQPAGFITPKIVYRTNGTDTRALQTVTRTANVATFTATSNHGFRVGGNLTIAGVGDASFNGASQYVASVPTPTTFTIRQVAPDATSSSGQATTLSQGGCLTGGAFYDGTRASADYRGNFFYGDCNSGRINRARIDAASNEVVATDHWATGISAQVDVASGPDGALYYTGTNTNNILRAAFNTSTQGIVIGNQHLRIDEGGAAVTTISLATAPVAPVQVNVALSAGSSDVSIAAGATLTFTNVDWMRPQLVRLVAATDVDLADDAATISASASGLVTEVVNVTVLDLDRNPDTIFLDGFD
jgi:glucose/arabinose dehydrogenase